MCLNHALKDVADRHWLSLTGEMVGHRKNCTQVVGRVSPLRSEPTIIEIKPPDLRANVERATDGVELEVRPGNLRAWCEAREHVDTRHELIVHIPFGTMVPGTTGPMRREHASKRKPSRPHPIVSIKQSRAVSNASSESIW